MIKLVYCLRRIAELTPQNFQDHWLNHHYQYGARMGGIRRYIQYHRVLDFTFRLDARRHHELVVG
jgi:hypothetical protein